MKALTSFLSTLIIAILFSSCARDYHLELVGHYKHKSENIQKQLTNLQQAKEDMLTMQSTIKEQPETRSAEGMPHPDLQNAGFQSQILPNVISEQKKIRVEKILAKAVLKNEKIAAEISKQNLKNEQLLTSNNHHSSSGLITLILLVILAIVLPPLAVALVDGIGFSFWLDLILTLCLWVPGVVYALIVLFSGGSSSST